MVPCSRSRMIAAPDRMMASMVTLLMIPITLVNHAVVTLGLKAIRTTRLTGAGAVPCAREKVADLGGDDLLRVAGPEARLHHRGRVDIHLDRGLASAENVALKIGRDVDHERIFAGIHQGDDVPLGDRLRRLEVRRQERVRDAARELRFILVDDADRGIMKLLRITLRLHDHGQGERVDDQPQENVIVQEAAQLLGAEPENIGDSAHRGQSP